MKPVIVMYEYLTLNQEIVVYAFVPLPYRGLGPYQT